MATQTATRRDHTIHRPLDCDQHLAYCGFVRYLSALEMKAGENEGLGGAARSALDMLDCGTMIFGSSRNLRFLSDLVNGIIAEGHSALRTEIYLCAHRCPVCAALAIGATPLREYAVRHAPTVTA